MAFTPTNIEEFHEKWQAQPQEQNIDEYQEDHLRVFGRYDRSFRTPENNSLEDEGTDTDLLYSSSSDQDESSDDEFPSMGDDDVNQQIPNWYDEGVRTATKEEVRNFYDTYQAQPYDDLDIAVYNREYARVRKRERKDEWEAEHYQALRNMGREARTQAWERYLQRYRGGELIDASLNQTHKEQRFIQAIRNNDYHTINALAPHV